MIRNKVNNSSKNSSEVINLTMTSVDGAFLGLEEEKNVNNQLQALEKEFKMNLSEYSEELREQITYILSKLLEYPSSQQAQEHQHANRLGLYDLKSSKDNQISKEWLGESSKVFCKDCGLAIQPQPIPLCTQFHRFPKVGIAAYLYFQNIKNLMMLLILLAIIYSGYALYTNIKEPSTTLSFANFPKKLSFASTVQNLVANSSLYDSMLYEGWMVAGLILIWWIGLFIMKRTALRQERMVDDETITAADFSIMFHHIPADLTKELLQVQLDLYYQKLREKQNIHGKSDLKPFTIRNYCKGVPFYFLEDQSIKTDIKDLDEQISQKCQQISELIQEVKDKGKFVTTSQARKDMYSTYIRLCSQRSKKQKQLKDLSKKFNWMQNKELMTAVFVTFHHSQSANTIETANPMGFAAKLRYYISCCQSGLFFSLTNSSNVVASRAPEPQDIIWENIGIPDCSIILRKMLTYFVTILLLSVSFGVVYGLTLLQITYPNDILSIAISLSITVINLVLGAAIRKLTIYECDITSTSRQTGLAIKSIFAQLMNSILVPIATNLYIQKNIYEANGLVYDIFYLALTNALLPPILKFIDIPYRLKRIAICYYSNSYEKLSLSQKQLNQTYLLAEFELGVAYIYFIDLFYFTCFYVFVHPCIVLFSLIGFGLMFWAQKYTLLNRSKRPTPSSAMLNNAMWQLVVFAPCMLSLGQFVWFNLIREDYHNFSDSTYISHLVAIGCSTLFFFLPFNSIFNAICSVPDDEDMNYDDVRSHLTSDYDILNPVTAENALGEFLGKDEGKIKQKGNNGQIRKPKKTQRHFQQTEDNIMKGNSALFDINEPQQKDNKSKVIKVQRRNNQISEESMNDVNNQMEIEHNLDFIDDPELENNKFMAKYQAPRQRKRRNRNSNQPQSTNKSSILDNQSGYNANALKKRDNSMNNPYNGIKF